MPLTTIGTMSQNFLSQSHNVSIRSRMTQLSTELSTGQKSDLARHVGADNKRIAHVDRRLDLLNGLNTAANETLGTFSAMQLALSTIETTLNDQSARLIKINSASSQAEVEVASHSAMLALETTVTALNTQYAGKSLFSGNETDRAALISAADIISDIESAIPPGSPVSAVHAAIDDWFTPPAGGFHTIGYTGQTGAPEQKQIGDDFTYQNIFRADSDEIQKLLKGMITSAIASSETLALPQSAQKILLRDAGGQLLNTSQDLVSVKARLGSLEQGLEELTTRYQSEKTALSIARNDIAGVDQFETATALQEVQTQLETHYTVTARLSRLNLASYIR